MYKIMGTYIAAIWLTLLAAVSAQAQGPHAVVEKVQQELLALIKTDVALLETEPEAFYRAVDQRLDSAVAFSYIARVVMGKYEKIASDAQREAFIKVFRDGLVKTYAKGMAGYAGQELKVIPADRDYSKAKSATVGQEIVGPEGVIKISYSMRKGKDGNWMLVNVVLDGINLGKTFRGQFAQAAAEHGGDIDKVISGWGAEG